MQSGFTEGRIKEALLFVAMAVATEILTICSCHPAQVATPPRYASYPQPRAGSYLCGDGLLEVSSEVMGPTVDVRRNFLFGGYKLDYTNQFEFTPCGLSTLIDGYFSALFPYLVPSETSGELLDFKGRNRQDLLNQDLPRLEKDELFLLEGAIAVGERKDDFEWDNFLVSCSSIFRRFEGTHHIVHGTELCRTGAFPAWIPLRLLGRVAPVIPNLFRFGIEHFQSSLFSGSLGYAPSVTETILVDATDSSVMMKVSVESKKREPAQILDRLPFLARTLDIIGKATGQDVCGSYLTALRK